MVQNFANLITCLSNLLNVSAAYEWVLCPGSTNCLCPEGFNGQGANPPRCLKFSSASKFCDPRLLIVEVRQNPKKKSSLNAN